MLKDFKKIDNVKVKIFRILPRKKFLLKVVPEHRKISTLLIISFSGDCPVGETTATGPVITLTVYSLANPSEVLVSKYPVEVCSGKYSSVSMMILFIENLRQLLSIGLYFKLNNLI
jgi:hypothetical protein